MLHPHCFDPKPSSPWGEVLSCVCRLSHASFLACGSFPVCHQAPERWVPGTCAVQFSALWSCYSSKDAAGGTLSLLVSITMWLGEDNLQEEPISVSLVISRMFEKEKNFAVKQCDRDYGTADGSCSYDPSPSPPKLIPSLCDLRAWARIDVPPTPQREVLCNVNSAVCIRCCSFWVCCLAFSRCLCRRGMGAERACPLTPSAVHPKQRRWFWS